VLLALLNSASYLSNSQPVVVQGKELMSHAQPYYISPAYAFVAYPNRDSTPFREWYDIPEAETVVRGTLRYQGFPEFVKALVELGWLDETKQEWLVEGMEWREVMRRVVGTEDVSERYARSIV
jgi:spermidine synthase / saccharopine dehydrogenase (NADP+, L-glutamate-forming)